MRPACRAVRAVTTPAAPHDDPFLSRRSLLRLARSTSGYALPKSTVLIAPLLLARAMSMPDYGLLEYVIAWGTPLTTVVGLGLSGGIPYFLLKRKRPQFSQVFNAYILLLGLLMAAGAALRIAQLIPLVPYMLGLITVVSVMQALYSITYKVERAPVWASAAESGLYVVLLFLAAAFFWFKPQHQILWINVALNLFGAIMVGGAARNYHPAIRLRHTRRRFREALKFGLPQILSGILLGFIASGGRMLAGHFFPLEVVGVYGFFFRTSAIVLVVYQLLTTVYFRRFYEADGDVLDGYFTWFLGLIFALSASSVLIGPLVLARLFPKYWYHQSDSLQLYLVLGCQMVLWCGTAMLEMILYREKQGPKLLWILVVALLFLAVAAGLYPYFGTLTLLRLCQLHLLTVFLSVQGQILLLRRIGLPFRKLRTAVTGVLALYFLGNLALAHF